MNYLISAVFSLYGFTIGMAILLCILLAYTFNKKRGYNPDFVFTVAICTLPLAIIGARVFYIVFDIIGDDATLSSWFKPNGNFTLFKFFGFRHIDGKWKFEGVSGLAIYGGLIFAALGGLIARWWNKKDKNPTNRMSYIQMLDAFFVLIILGQCIGRWGNYFNQEAYGNYVGQKSWFPYAVYIENPKNPGEIAGYYQATFFYESFLNFIGFFGLLYLSLGKRKSFDGFVFSSYCIWYGLVRMFVEGLRGDSLYLGAFRVSQLLSGILVLTGAAFIVFHVVMARKRGKKPFILVKESLLNTDYYGYDKTIIYINSIYNKDGKLKVDKHPVPCDVDTQEISTEAQENDNKYAQENNNK